MKKESKKSKNVMKTVKILTIIFLIVLVSMIGFFGIYKQNKNQVSNIMKDYSYAMDIKGSRTLKLALNSENGDDVKTEENYKTAKNVIEKRLKKLGVEEYKISLNEQNGEMILNHVSFSISPKDKVAFVSDNELAVTSFFKIIMGEITDYQGSFQWGITTSRSYFPKDNNDYYTYSTIEVLKGSRCFKQ